MIDAPTTRDRDDALYVQPRSGGGWILKVFIADVPSGLPLGSDVDVQARRRGQTFYGPTSTKPMLPIEREKALTLAEDKSRAALRVDMRFSEQGEIEEYSLKRCKMAGAKAVAYAEVPAILADSSHPLHADMVNAERLSKVLMEARRNAGALTFYDLTKGWATDEDGHLIRLDDPELNVGYIIVQECMVAANRAVASWAIDRDLPILFRNHVPTKVSPAARELAQDVALAVAEDSLTALRVMYERLQTALRAAEYGATTRGHFALTLSAYTHATSPLRRYADVVTLRQVLAVLDEREPPYSSEELTLLAGEINKREQERREREREALKGKGSEPLPTFTPLAAQAGAFSDTPPKQFSAMVKEVARGNLWGEGLQAEVLRRAEELPLADMVMVLLVAKDERWGPTRSALMERLAKCPSEAVSILAIHAQLQGQPLAAFAEEVTENGFACRASFQGVNGASRRANVKKVAQQQAALSLLAKLANTDDPSGDLEAKPLESFEPRLMTNGQNPVSAINENVQIGFLKNVQWDFKRTGPDHAPKFTAWVKAETVSGESFSTSGEAASKAGARERAAAALIDQLHGDGSRDSKER
jgi:ribonuclease R